jgi:hypothetical protein
MPKPLADQLETAILRLVCWNPSDALHQANWSGWSVSVRQEIAEAFVDADLFPAFRRLWSTGSIRITKPGSQRRHETEYQKGTDDETFFFTDRFNATITYAGRKRWDTIRIARTGTFISHISEEKPVALPLVMPSRLPRSTQNS